MFTSPRQWFSFRIRNFKSILISYSNHNPFIHVTTTFQDFPQNFCTHFWHLPFAQHTCLVFIFLLTYDKLKLWRMSLYRFSSLMSSGPIPKAVTWTIYYDSRNIHVSPLVHGSWQHTLSNERAVLIRMPYQYERDGFLSVEPVCPYI